jgi:hypothetical protein
MNIRVKLKASEMAKQIPLPIEGPTEVWDADKKEMVVVQRIVDYGTITFEPGQVVEVDEAHRARFEAAPEFTILEEKPAPSESKPTPQAVKLETSKG